MKIGGTGFHYLNLVYSLAVITLAFELRLENGAAPAWVVFPAIFACFGFAISIEALRVQKRKLRR
jgi:hypothetical protein